MTFLKQPPYAPLPMETADWLARPMQDLRLADLHLTQDVLAIEGIERALRGVLPACGDPAIHVVRHEGQLYVDNGHCRVVVAMMRGHSTILGRVVDA